MGGKTPKPAPHRHRQGRNQSSKLPHINKKKGGCLNDVTDLQLTKQNIHVPPRDEQGWRHDMNELRSHSHDLGDSNWDFYGRRQMDQANVKCWCYMYRTKTRRGTYFLHWCRLRSMGDYNFHTISNFYKYYSIVRQINTFYICLALQINF